MKVIEEGHVYELSHLDNKDEFQTLSFISKFHGVDHDGTTTEEVLAALIDRLGFFQSNPDTSCRENSIAITKMEEALMWLEKRTADREDRGVEGTNQQ